MTITMFRSMLCFVLCLLSVQPINGDGIGIDASEPFYTAADSASWAVTSDTLSPLLGRDKQKLYDDFIAGCNDASVEKERQKQLNRGQEIDEAALAPVKTRCNFHDQQRVRMNAVQPSSVYNYTKNGYAKIRAPPGLFSLIQQFWKENRDKAETEWKEINVYHNTWDAPPSIVHLNQEHSGGSAALQSRIWSEAQPILEEWTGQYLSPVSLYGIRLYHNGSILVPHVDRMPLVTSAIIQVDQDVDEPWPLEVYGHDGKATNVTMEPGDMVLYESHSVIHGRPFPMKGNFYANCFIHFEPYAPKEGESKYDPKLDIPPYMIPGSAWESEWRSYNPRGWRLSDKNIVESVRSGDFATVQKTLRYNPNIVDEEDDLGWTILHEAVRAGHRDMVELFIAHGADKNHLTKHGFSPLSIARQHLKDENHTVVQFLKSLGANDIVPSHIEL